MTDPNNTQAAINAGARFGEVRALNGFVPFTLQPEGTTVVHLERLDERPRPEHIKASPKFDNSASLVDYFNRFQDVDSTLFADLDSSTVVAILDHHQDNPDEMEGLNGGARYHDHVATFKAKHSPEWLAWVGMSGKRVSQEAFAIFIEDNAPDVQSPSAASLGQMALNLEAAGSSEFKSSKRLEDGSVHLYYAQEVNGTSNGVPVPKEFKILLRPYIGSEAVAMTAKFRFNKDGGKLTMGLDLMLAEQTKRAAFDSIVEKIAADTERTVLWGRPA